jgi:glycosyltransferase involved in cell wall biosynthesis
VSALYVSYDGALEPLGQSQVVPYLRGMARLGAKLTLLSYEKASDLRRAERVRAVREDLVTAGIRWVPLRYHKRPTSVATSYDIVQGVLTGARVGRRDGVALVHASSYVPAVIGLALKRLLRLPLLFDMRGLWADERIEGGIWPAGSPLYHLAKRAERRLLLDADAVVCQTDRAHQEIATWPAVRGQLPPLTVIPTSVDLARFRIRPAAEQLRRASGLAGSFVVGYLGSLGTWYLLEEMLACFRVLQAIIPRAHFLLLTPSDPEPVHRAASRQHVDPRRYTVRAVEHAEVPAWLSLVDLGLYFIRPTYSKLAASPTKLGEFLASGVPVLTNAGIGDTDRLVRDAGVAVLVEALNQRAYEAAALAVQRLCADPDRARRCREVAAQALALDAAVAAYYDLYQRLVRPNTRGPRDRSFAG